MIFIDSTRAARPVAWTSIALGMCALSCSLWGHGFPAPDAILALLSLLALSVGATVLVKTPRAGAYVATADVIVFIAVLTCDVSFAAPLAALATLAAAIRFQRGTTQPLVAASLAALATFASAWLAQRFVSLEFCAPNTLFFIGLLTLAFARAFVGAVPAGCVAARDGKQGRLRAYMKAAAGGFVLYLIAASLAGLVVLALGRVSAEYVWAGLAAVGLACHAFDVRRKAGRAGTDEAAPRARAATLSETGENLRHAFDHAATGTAIVSARGEFVRVNESLSQLLGRPAEELLASCVQDIVHPDDLGPVLAGMKDVLRGKTSALRTDVRHPRQDGGTVWAHWSVGRFVAPHSDEARLIVQAHDVTERKLSEQKLLHDACHDTLTGLPNRALFADHVKLSITRARRREGVSFAVLFLDSTT